MVESEAPVGSKPINVAPVIIAFWPRMKSSAVSVSSAPPLAGRERVAIRPSGLPVLKITPAAAGVVRRNPVIPSAAISFPTVHLPLNSHARRERIRAQIQPAGCHAQFVPTYVAAKKSEAYAAALRKTVWQCQIIRRYTCIYAAARKEKPHRSGACFQRANVGLL